MAKANLKHLSVYALVAGIAFCVYLPALQCGFVEFDDPDYVYRNEVVRGGLTIDGVKYAFTSTELANWFPLTLLSHQADVSLYGLEPWGHHLTNMLLHACNSMLLLSVLFGATRLRWPSLAVALLFAVHPLHVESVAWVAERKDMLSAFFALLTIRCYLEWVDGRRRKLGYAMSLVCFTFALMSKPMPVTLPFVLLLFDAWPLNRFELKPCEIVRGASKIVAEKIPFFMLTGASILVTLYVQSQGGATSTLTELTLVQRLANAAISYWAYVGDTIWPAGLSPIYPHPRHNVSIAFGVLSVAGLVAVSIGALAVWRKHGYLATGWLIFLGVLVPMIGIVQVGYQARADRYMHFPIIGLFIVAVWTAVTWAGKRPGPSRLVGAAVLCAVVAYSAVTVRQIGYWNDSETLFQRALAVTEDNYFAHQELGLLRYREGRLDEAEFHYLEALRLGPEAAALHSNLAEIKRRLGKPEDALPHGLRAAELDPNETAVFRTLGWIYFNLGQATESGQAFERALELDAENVDAFYGLGLLLAIHGRTHEALPYIEAAIRLEPDHEDARLLIEQLRVAVQN